MVRRTKEEAEQTRSHIMATALDLFCRHGLAKTSLTDIAQTADLSRGAIYWHFRNKEELFVSLWEELCAPLAENMYACLNPDEPDPLGRLRIFLHQVMHKIVTEQAHRQMFSLIFHVESLEGEGVALREHMRQQSIRFHRDLEMTLLNARNHGQLPSHADPKRLAILMHCMLDGYIINWLHFPEYINLEEEIDFMLDTLFGLFTIQRVDNDILTPNA